MGDSIAEPILNADQRRSFQVHVYSNVRFGQDGRCANGVRSASRNWQEFSAGVFTGQ